MLNKISTFIARHLQPASGATPQLSQQQKHLATAALLIEVAVADHHFDSRELKSLNTILQQKFSLSDSQITELIEIAKEESSEATSLHQFTQLIHQYCEPQEKFELLISMWELAYADQQVDKYEEYLIRKVADLIYVPHSEFIRAKTIAKQKCQ